MALAVRGTCTATFDFFGCAFRCSLREGHRIVTRPSTPTNPAEWIRVHRALVRKTPLGVVDLRWW